MEDKRLDFEAGILSADTRAFSAITPLVMMRSLGHWGLAFRHLHASFQTKGKTLFFQ